MLLATPLCGQDASPGFTVGLRVGGVIGTRLIADDIGQSLIPDTVIERRFQGDSVLVRMRPAPDVTLVLGVPLSDDTDLQLAAGYTPGRLDVSQSGEERDGGTFGLGHAMLSIGKPVRGVTGRMGVGVLWFQGGEITAIREMRSLNPLLEVAASRRWVTGALQLEAGLAAQAAQLSSAALEARQGPPGMFYRLALELGVARRIGR